MTERRADKPPQPIRILLLNQYYPPDSGATARIIQDLAEVLAERHQVTILTGRPSYDPEERPAPRLQRQGNLTVRRVPSTAFHRRRMAGRLANYLSYLALAFFRALLFRPKPHVIIAMTDPPLVCLAGALAALVRRSLFVYNIRDIHPDMALAAGVVKPGLFVFLWERLHRWSMRRAHLLIVLGEDMKERIVSKGIDPRRVVVVRDGARPLPPPDAGQHPAVAEIRGGSPFVVVHAGNLGFAGAWDTILEAARRLKGEEIEFVFIGDGAVRPALEQKANGIGNVRFLPFRPPDLLPYVLASADLHIVTAREGLEGLVVPSKLYPILMAGRPVLAVTPRESDIARLVQQHRCGLVADPEDPEGVSRAILWARRHPDELAEMARCAGAAGPLFDRGALAKEFVKCIEDLVHGPGAQQPETYPRRS